MLRDRGRFGNHPGLKASPNNLPEHIAVIMDGNGRWAAARKLSRTAGHKQGVQSTRDIIASCQEKGIKVLTLFAFGVENWKRPPQEVRNLFRIFFLALRKEFNFLRNKGIKLKIIGDRSSFNSLLIKAIEEAEKYTQDHDGLILNIAVNYSGRWDLMNAIQRLAKKVHQGECDHDKITETTVADLLALQGLPEPDLFIRTGGVQRISNFMLWELAYTELFFTPTLWPDFSKNEFELALQDYAKRERRFGLAGEQLG